MAQTVKNLHVIREIEVQSLGRGDPLEEEMATHSSILAWRIPWTQEPGRLQSIGSQRVRHDWVTNTPAPRATDNFLGHFLWAVLCWKSHRVEAVTSMTTNCGHDVVVQPLSRVSLWSQTAAHQASVHDISCHSFENWFQWNRNKSTQAVKTNCT